MLENNRDMSDEGDTEDDDSDRLLIMWMVVVVVMMMVVVMVMKHTSSLGENGKIRALRLQKALKTVDLVVLWRRSNFFALLPFKKPS